MNTKAIRSYVSDLDMLRSEVARLESAGPMCVINERYQSGDALFNCESVLESVAEVARLVVLKELRSRCDVLEGKIIDATEAD